MLCTNFEDRLTDYLDGALSVEERRAFAEHALRCPVCHDLLSSVKQSLEACRTAEPPVPPSPALEARILSFGAPDAAMTCEEFEERLTDYLDGFLPAPVYRRWQRHAALCSRCTELPGQVVRSIGACYTYINEERPVPAGLHARILQATLGTTDAASQRAPLPARIAATLRAWLDPLVAPHLAAVATMLLICMTILTSMVSADGSISGMYRTSFRLAKQTYEQGAQTAVKGAAVSGDIKQITSDLTNLLEGAPSASSNANNQSKQAEQSQASGTAANKPASQTK